MIDQSENFEQLKQQTMQAFQQKDFHSARKNGLRLIQMQPEMAYLYANVGLAELRLGLLEEAYTHYSHAIALSDESINTTIYDGFVEVCYLLKKTEEQQKIAMLSLQHKATEVQHVQALPLTQPRPVFNPLAVQRNIISFSLFGQQAKYCETAILNVKKAKQLYPEWTCRFYVDYSVPFHVVLRLQYLGAQVIYVTEEQQKISGLFWRFLVMEDPDVDFYLIRDADSLVSYREQAAVDQWLNSERYFHIMRDGYTHTELIFAGMFGGCSHVFSDLLLQIRHFIHNGDYLNTRVMDQHFLRHCIWPTFRQSVLIHDSQHYTVGGFDFPPPKQTPAEELIQNFHVGQNHASQEISIQFHYPAQRIAWLLLDESRREICRYEQKLTSDQTTFSISLPYEYICMLQAGKWCIRHYAV